MPSGKVASVPGLSAHIYLIANTMRPAGCAWPGLRDNILAEACEFPAFIALADESPPGAGDVGVHPVAERRTVTGRRRRARAGFHNLSMRATKSGSRAERCWKELPSTIDGCTDAVEALRQAPSRIRSG